MQDQLNEVSHKLKKVRNRAKDDEKKFADTHESVVHVEERCRKMEEIVKFRVADKKKGVKEVVDATDISEMEGQYEAMIFEKEEQQITQESDMGAQLEEIKKVEATIAALEKRYTEVQRENKQMDYELGRNNQAPVMTARVSSQNLSRINQRNIGRQNGSIISGNYAMSSQVGKSRGKPTISTSVDLSGRLNGRFASITPKGHLHSTVDQTHGYLEQILSKQEKAVSKSLIADEGFSSRLVVPRSTRNRAYGLSRDINAVNVSVIPPPTSIH